MTRVYVKCQLSLALHSIPSSSYVSVSLSKPPPPYYPLNYIYRMKPPSFYLLMCFCYHHIIASSFPHTHSCSILYFLSSLSCNFIIHLMIYQVIRTKSTFSFWITITRSSIHWYMYIYSNTLLHVKYLRNKLKTSQLLLRCCVVWTSNNSAFNNPPFILICLVSLFICPSVPTRNIIIIIGNGLFPSYCRDDALWRKIWIGERTLWHKPCNNGYYTTKKWFYAAQHIKSPDEK